MKVVSQFIRARMAQCQQYNASVMLFTILFLLTSLFSVQANTETTATANPPINDVRVLIDISGSMKLNDPANLRKPALNLFISLLPNETQSGVWTFGQWVNMLIPRGSVTKKWKDEAKKSVQKINSAGLYTNIEDALRRSTWDWRNTAPTANSERSLILLTDGLVDISKNTQENHTSRKNILQELLPILQKSGVTIHAIALSKDSDKNLLEQLTTATGGKFETIETAKGLERIFLHLFENVAPTDSLPLNENRVKVDSSIKEMTFLIFTENSEEETSITSPSGDIYDINNQAAEMTWHKESHYNLVTVKKPLEGYWKINSKVDPDNRVMVVTDLKLVSSKLPSTLYAGANQKVEIHLEDNGSIIDRRDFLHFVKVNINQESLDNKNKEKSWKFKVLDNGKKFDKKQNDGIYSLELNKSLIAGEHEIEISVNGTTFRRQFRKQIIIYDKPATANIESISNKIFSVSVLPYQTLIDSESMRVTATHKRPNGDKNKVEITRLNPSEWAHEFATDEIKGVHKVTIRVSGKDHDGKPIKAKLKTLKITVGNKTESSLEKTGPEKENKLDDGQPENNSEAEVSWVMVSLKIGAFNIIIILICFFAYKYRTRIRQKLFTKIVEETTNA